MKPLRSAALALGLLFLNLAAVADLPETHQILDPGWPKEVAAEGTGYTIYQPQVDSWNGYLLEAHAAIAVTEPEAEQAIYGVMAFTARSQVDKTERMVTLDQLQTGTVRFPSAPDKQDLLGERFQEQVIDWVRVISLDRLEAGVALLEARETGSEVPVRNDPPRIIFSHEPAVLIYVDGDPVYESIEGSKYERVLNTRILVLKDSNGMHYVRILEGWMSSASIEGPWEVAKKKPSKIKKAMKATLEKRPADLLEADEQKDEEGKKTKPPTLKKGPVPTLFSATSSTELIVFEGKPDFVDIAGTQLLYAQNTGGNVFRNLEDQKLYVLISGRWYRSTVEKGPWQHVAQTDLPGEFAEIPDESPKENVKASVAGTAQAQEALIANSIPETAEVKRSAAKFEPTFDGEPRMVAIEETELQRVENSPDPVIMVTESSYYALHDGVWFVASVLAGPWKVADTIPAAIYSIPASSPIHNVTYVKVYDSSPEVVVVGYTPGYYGTVVTNGVVVYGTGYAYSPWIGHHWYGYPMTWGWGCGITYSPWAGWSFSFGVSFGWGHWGSPWWGPYPSPYWGPYYGYGHYGYPGYYGGAAWGPGGAGAVWGPGGWAGTTGNVYHRWGSTSAVTRASGGYNAWTGNGWRDQVGASYNSRTGTLAAGQRAAVGNVYTGDYAYGKRGVAGNREAGIVAAGSKATVGNAYRGGEVTAGRATVHNRNTGETTRVGGIRGEQGSVGRAGDNVFGTKDGNVYRRSGQGSWEQLGGSGSWGGLEDSGRKGSLERQYGARSKGSMRSGAQQRSRQSAGSFSRGSGMRTGARRAGGRRR